MRFLNHSLSTFIRHLETELPRELYHHFTGKLRFTIDATVTTRSFHDVLVVRVSNSTGVIPTIGLEQVILDTIDDEGFFHHLKYHIKESVIRHIVNSAQYAEWERHQRHSILWTAEGNDYPTFWPTEEHRAWFNEAYLGRVEYWQIDTAPVEKAVDLLLSHLDSTQRETYKNHEHFLVTGQSGVVYRIRRASQINVDVMNNDKVAYSLCTVADPKYNDVPIEDNMLAQKTLIELNEEEFLKVAIKHHTYWRET